MQTLVIKAVATALLNREWLKRNWNIRFFNFSRFFKSTTSFQIFWKGLNYLHMFFHLHNNRFCTHIGRYSKRLYSLHSHHNLVYEPSLKGYIHRNLNRWTLKFESSCTNIDIFFPHKLFFVKVILWNNQCSDTNYIFECCHTSLSRMSKRTSR